MQQFSKDRFVEKVVSHEALALEADCAKEIQHFSIFLYRNNDGRFFGFFKKYNLFYASEE